MHDSNFFDTMSVHIFEDWLNLLLRMIGIHKKSYNLKKNTEKNFSDFTYKSLKNVWIETKKIFSRLANFYCQNLFTFMILWVEKIWQSSKNNPVYNINTYKKNSQHPRSITKETTDELTTLISSDS